MTIWRWQDGFDRVPQAAQVTLGEGGTPLVRSRRLGTSVGLRRLYFKLESCNPSGSYKDRFAVGAISHMVAEGKRRCIATSSGNTGSALAAYCAAAGLACEIAIVEAAPLGKLQQMMSYGASIFRVRGFGIDAGVSARVFDSLQRMAQARDAALQISAFKFSPRGMTAVRTVAFELAEQAPEPIHDVFTQAGGGGLTVATAEGFQYLFRQRRLERVPRVHCVQPAGNDTIAGPLRRGDAQGQNVACTTQVSGLQVPTVIDGHQAIEQCRATGGTGYVVSDEEVWETQRRLAREEGIFCEPAAATAVAGALAAARQGELSPDSVVVCLITGLGFKDPPSIERLISDRTCPLISADDLEARAADH